MFRATTQTTASAEPLDVARRPGRIALRVDGGEPLSVSLDQPMITVGRSDAAALTIPHGSVSKKHFTLRVTDAGVEITDLGSKNGIWFRDRRFQQVTLEPGDAFFAGQCPIEIVDVDQVDVQVTVGDSCGTLFGRSVVMRELFGYLGRVAPAPLDVLIYGESGTGKELTARTIHELSPRRERPFITLDCASLPSTLADATLFGFRRGAFTGAEHEQIGLFEQADGGTLFIDELGELSTELQAKFLRAVDQRQISRLGEPGNVRTVDVRVVAATNRNLDEEMANGRFRADLYHRIRQSIVRLPNLRDRGLDVVLLAERMLEALCTEHDLKRTLGEDATVALLAYAWPGNVRELKNVIKQAAFTCMASVIHADELRLGQDTQWTRRIAEVIADGDRQYEEVHLLVDRHFLPRVLEATGSIKGAAKLLGISRDRLRARLRELGLYGAESV